MDLLFSENSTKHATLSVAATGQPLYEIATAIIQEGSWRKLPITETTVQKYAQAKGALHPEAIGTMRVHAGRNAKKDDCHCRGRDVLPKRDGWFKSSRSFTTTNGHHLKWKYSSMGSKAELTDGSHTSMASWEKSHAGILSGKARHATLSISPAALPLADDIVVSFVYLAQDMERTRKANAAGGAAGASAAVIS